CGANWRGSEPALVGSPSMRRGMGAHLQPFTTTIFNEMSVLAARTGSINLGQGFPDTDGPPEVAEAAVAAIRAGHNQYPPGAGLPALRQAIADHQRRWYGLDHDPDTEVVVTMGATEAIAAARVCLEHDLLAVTDEVYEHLVYDGRHIPLATLPGLAERTVTISSHGKTFSFTGWKVGWACGPADLIDAVRTTKQYLSYSG